MMNILSDKKTAIYLTSEEALLFVEFQKRFAFIQALNSIGAFDIKGGSLEVHFDALGQIGSMAIHRHYKTL